MMNISKCFGVAAALACMLSGEVANGAEKKKSSGWWSLAAEAALERAGTNRVEMEAALKKAPRSRREGIQFLVENMPDPDLKRLSSTFLLEHLNLAYDAFEKAPWKKRIPKEIFLNDILPYASVDETREVWRPQLRELAQSLILGCKTPAEAAQRINEKLFSVVNVKYSTQRRKANQSPSESMETGLASCTGLSILLVDACRSVGIPARLVGTPLWANKRGNHTWVEIWDQGWHFTGACEQDPQGLNRGWFVGDAAQAIKESREHAIYATSFKKTGTTFPMVWNRFANFVNAENVTDRYARPKTTDTSLRKLMVKVYDAPNGRRVAAAVKVLDPADPQARWEGTSAGESRDLNDILTFEVPREKPLNLRVELNGASWSRDIPPSEETIVLYLNTPPSASAGGGK